MEFGASPPIPGNLGTGRNFHHDRLAACAIGTAESERERDKRLDFSWVDSHGVVAQSVHIPWEPASFSLSSDERTACLTDSTGSIYLWHQGTDLHKLALPLLGDEPPTLSADGKRLTLASKSVVQTWALDTGQPIRRRTPPLPVTGDSHTYLSPGGAWAVTITSDASRPQEQYPFRHGKVVVWPVTDERGPAQPISTLPCDLDQTLCATVSEDGERVVLVQNDGQVRLFSRRSGHMISRFRPPTGEGGRTILATHASFLRSGKGIVVAYTAGNSRVFPTDPADISRIAINLHTLRTGSHTLHPPGAQHSRSGFHHDRDLAKLHNGT